MSTTRTTLFAAFHPVGDADLEPVLGVWDFNRRRLARRIADRIANGEAFGGETIVRVTVATYNRLVSARGFPEVRS